MLPFVTTFSVFLMLIIRSVPANYASFPILHQLFARLGMDDNIETNVSTFAAEMREIAFILRNVDRRSLYV
jgi:DNA mismatch repair protein MSH4